MDRYIAKEYGWKKQLSWQSKWLNNNLTGCMIPGTITGIYADYSKSGSSITVC